MSSAQSGGHSKKFPNYWNFTIVRMGKTVTKWLIWCPYILSEKLGPLLSLRYMSGASLEKEIKLSSS